MTRKPKNNNMLEKMGILSPLLNQLPPGRHLIDWDKPEELLEWNFREVVEDEEFLNLCDSIDSTGIAEPIQLTMTAGEERAEVRIVTGHRRTRAIIKLRKLYPHRDFPLPAIVHVREKSVSDISTDITSVVSNLFRKDMSVFDRANGFKRLLDQGLNKTKIAVVTGFDRKIIERSLNVLLLPDVVKTKSLGSTDVSVYRAAQCYKNSIKAGSSEEAALAGALEALGGSEKKAKASGWREAVQEGLLAAKCTQKQMDIVISYLGKSSPPSSQLLLTREQPLANF